MIYHIFMFSWNDIVFKNCVSHSNVFNFWQPAFSQWKKQRKNTVCSTILPEQLFYFHLYLYVAKLSVSLLKIDQFFYNPKIIFLEQIQQKVVWKHALNTRKVIFRFFISYNRSLGDKNIHIFPFSSILILTTPNFH